MSGSMGFSPGLLETIAHPQVLNPLAAYADANKVAQGVWANREWQAKQAAGDAQRNALDANGVYQPNVAGQNLRAAGPTAALAVPSTLESSQRLSDAQLAQAQKLVGFVNSASGAALKAGDFSDQAMEDLRRQALGAGFTWPQMQQAFQNLPADPAGRKAWLEQHQMTSASTQQQLEQQYGTRQPVNTGGATVFPVVPPASAGGPGPVVPNTTSPAQRIAPVTGPAGPRGQPTTITADEYARSRGLDPVTGNPLPNPAFKDLPPALRNPNAAPPPAPPPQATGAGPADTSAMGAGGTASSATYQGVSDDATHAVGRRALLLSMAGDATQFTTGPGAATLKDIKATMQAIGSRLGTSFGIDADKLAAQEDLFKIGNQLADAQGARSDARLSVTQGANPTEHNTPAGLRLILNKLTGNEDYNVFKGQAAADYQRTKDPTGAHAREFEAEFRDKYDPRAFQFNRLNAEQQRQYLGELGAGKDAFKRKFIEMKTAGVLPGG